ncbi:MAG: 4,5-dihydroxyphthalate decarboxylase [Chloroflexi bacterium]|nr:4,5-dihydroxyphthalate decarboxylase [Chloroflexota bacterium]
MADVALDLALAKSFWTQAILDGSATARGVALNAFVVDPPDKRHEGMKNGEYDAAEKGYSGSLRDRALGQGYPQRSLPVWLNRGLRHKNIVTRKGSRIKTLGDLKGGRVGSVHYAATTNIWARQVLSDYGVSPRDATWVVTQHDDVSRSANVPIEVADTGGSHSIGALWPLLARGELDAVISPGFNWFYATFHTFAQGMADPDEKPAPGAERRVRGAAVPAELQGQIDSLVTDPEVCLEYVRRTKIYPLIHSVTIKEDVIEKHPWLAESLVEMFREARRLAPSYMTENDRRLMDREREGVGFDPYEQRWGESQERSTLALVRALVDQGFIWGEIEPDDFMVAGYREL